MMTQTQLVLPWEPDQGIAKVSVVSRPPPNAALIGHSFIAADAGQRIAVSQSFQDLVPNSRVIFDRAGPHSLIHAHATAFQAPYTIYRSNRVEF
jgi:hypothetical protein